MTKGLHNEILIALKRYAGHGNKHSHSSTYHGTSHFSYHISNPVKRKIAKEFLARHKTLSQAEFVALLTSLYQSKSHDEKSIAGILIGYDKIHRENILPRLLNTWLNHLEGWAEVDSLCQSNFTASEMLLAWNKWKPLITGLSKSKKIAKRRASLVLLTWPVVKSDDKRLSALAFENINRLKHERPILTTKAISWLLRSLIVNHKKDVVVYLKRNSETLPKVAIWEMTRKLRIGKK